jgi:hypothetical protein
MNGIGIPKAHLLATSLGTQIAVVMQTLAPGKWEWLSDISAYSCLEKISSLLLCGLLPERDVSLCL